jgi:hypothetical protein
MVNNILFLVGKQSDTYPVKYTSRKAPKWLKEGAKIFEEFVDDEDHMVPSDSPPQITNRLYVRG